MRQISKTKDILVARDFQINGNIVTRMSIGDWDDQPLASTLQGELIISSLKRHTWKSTVLTEAEYKLLNDLQGQRVTLTTVDYSNQNGDYVTYYGVMFRRLQANQISINMHQIQAEFLVNL